MRLIDGTALYEKAAEWEAQALHMVISTMNDEDTTEWRRWSTILTERSAFKFDVADAPTIDARATGRWIESTESKIRPYMCSNCGALYDVDTVMGELTWKYCPNCGSRNRRTSDDESR